MILLWQFGDRINIAKLTYAIINPFILQTWVFLHTCTLMKSANLKSCQHRFLSKPPNITSAYISAYTVSANHVILLSEETFTILN